MPDIHVILYIRLLSENGDQQHYPETIHGYRSNPYSVQKPALSDRLSFRGGIYGYYSIRFKLPLLEISEFTLQTPRFVINDTEQTISDIKYVLKTGWYFYPLNC